MKFIIVWILVVLYNVGQYGLATPRVDNDIEDNGGSFYRGQRRPPYASYMQYGKPAKKGQIPYHVRIINSKIVTLPNYSGAIISEHYVLSTARAMREISSCSTNGVRVQAGMVDIGKKDTITEFHAHEVICHNNYYHKILVNDIAIIKIKGTFNFLPYVRPVKISWRIPVPDTPVTISGWNSKTALLLYIKSYIIGTGECRQMLPKRVHSGLGCIHNYLQKFLYCTETGDWGGAVVHNGKLIGVINECWVPVSLYTKVAQYRKWIEDIVGSLSDVHA